MNIQEKQPSGATKVSAPMPDGHTARGGSIEGYNLNAPVDNDAEDEDDDDLLRCI